MSGNYKIHVQQQVGKDLRVLFIFLVFTAIHLFPAKGYSQTVIDGESKISIPYVKICAPNGDLIDHSNFYGVFSWPPSSDTLLLKAHGYFERIILRSEVADSISLIKSPTELDEIVITASRRKSKDSFRTVKGDESMINLVASKNGSLLVSPFQLEQEFMVTDFQFKLKRTDNIQTDFYLKPVLYKSNNKLPSEELISNANIFEIPQNFNGYLNIDISSFQIKLKSNETYFIGFYLFSKSANAQLSSNGICSKKGSKSFVKASAQSPWIEVPCLMDIEINLKKAY